MGILIVQVSGSCLNLDIHFKEPAEAGEDWYKATISIAADCGYYSGIFAGALVDDYKNKISFSIAAVTALVSYGSLAFMTDAEMTYIS